MKKNSMHFDINNAKIYKDSYRPSSNLSLFVRSLLAVILAGQSPLGKPFYYQNRKLK